MMKNLPINIIQTMFYKRTTHLLLTYLKLKTVSNDFGQIGIADIKGVAELIGLSPVSLKKHIVKLKELGYISEAINNKDLLVIKSIWKISNREVKIKGCTKSCRLVAHFDDVNFLDFSAKAISTFNAFLSECLIEKAIHGKPKECQDLAIAVGLAEEVVDKELKEKLQFQLKELKAAFTLLNRMKRDGNFGKSHSNIDYDIIRNQRNITSLKNKLEILIKNQESKELAKSKELQAVPQTTFSDQNPTDKESVMFSEKTNFNKNRKGTPGEVFDTPLSWSAAILKKSVTTVIKYRNKLAAQNYASLNPVNLNKDITRDSKMLINYSYPFKIVKSGKKLDGLSAEALSLVYDKMHKENKELFASKLIMTSAGIKEIYSSNRTSLITIKKKTVVKYEKYPKKKDI